MQVTFAVPSRPSSRAVFREESGSGQATARRGLPASCLAQFCPCICVDGPKPPRQHALNGALRGAGRGAVDTGAVGRAADRLARSTQWVRRGCRTPRANVCITPRGAPCSPLSSFVCGKAELSEHLLFLSVFAPDPSGDRALGCAGVSSGSVSKCSFTSGASFKEQKAYRPPQFAAMRLSPRTPRCLLNRVPGMSLLLLWLTTGHWLTSYCVPTA